MRKSAAPYLAYFFAALFAFVFFAHTGTAGEAKPQAEKLRQQLNTRNGAPLKTVVDAKALDKQINSEIRVLRQNLRRLVSRSFWEKVLKALRAAGEKSLFILLLFGFSLLLLFRFKRYCHGLQSHALLQQHAHRMTAFQILTRSVPLLGTTVFIYLYTQTDLPYASASVVQLVVHILLILLISGWWFDFLALKRQEEKQYEDLGHPLRYMIIFVGCFATVYLVFAWLIGKTGVLLFLGRLLFEVALLVWLILISKWCAAYANRQNAVFIQRIKTPIAAVGYLSAGGALLLELTGHNPYAVYWLASWGRSAAVFLWGLLIFLVLSEWSAEAQKMRAPAGEEAKISSFRWVAIWIGWLAWAAGALIGVIAAWGGGGPVILEFFKKLNSPFAIGNLRFQLTGFVYASLILLTTHGVSRIWRYVFKNKILASTDLESGLQESITTITVYILWILGILIALHVFGLNTTSLAVAFGALGIGLGFGLQNIFNNFISGVILLFERPIQVGDAIEINGTWASVKKINVRSTVVQTWDNASLIIPNSEFISKQVTNWSFKDMRLRLNINVGIAYGSDIELARASLLEVAENTPRVLKYPKPDVLFTDFGDSALIFRLRVWTVIDHMLTVGTAIRFEIDRLFRERGIVIAFPQQDIHIKTVDAAFPLDMRHKSEKPQGPADDDE